VEHYIIGILVKIRKNTQFPVECHTIGNLVEIRKNAGIPMEYHTIGIIVEIRKTLEFQLNMIRLTWKLGQGMKFIGITLLYQQYQWSSDFINHVVVVWKSG
jgi:hypothetical protein